MQEKIYAIKDSKAGCFPHPTFNQKTHGEAERTFTTLVNDPQTQINKYPEDFDLYYMGEFNTTTGKYTHPDTPQHIITASQLKKQ